MAHLDDFSFLTRGARKFCSLQKERAEKSANFLFLILIFGSKTREIRSKTQEKSLKKQTMAHLDDFSFLTRGARKFCSLQNERAEKSANFLFSIFIFGPKTKEIRSKTLEKGPKKADFGTFSCHLLKIRNLPPPNLLRHG